jgi:hypothetical protein
VNAYKLVSWMVESNTYLRDVLLTKLETGQEFLLEKLVMVVNSICLRSRLGECDWFKFSKKRNPAKPEFAPFLFAVLYTVEKPQMRTQYNFELESVEHDCKCTIKSGHMFEFPAIFDSTEAFQNILGGTDD